MSKRYCLYKRKKVKTSFRYLYGPVYSWRMGWSLGIDPLSRPEKICNFDCTYCQLGRTAELTTERREYVPVAGVLEETAFFPSGKIDFLTFSGRGEPTLAANLGEMIWALRRSRRERIAVLTNGALLFREDVREDLSSADYVSVKLDAGSARVFDAVAVPSSDQLFERLLKGLFTFRSFFTGTFALQVMMMDANRQEAARLARLARALSVDEVQLNTPLRPCGVTPLTPSQLQEVKTHFAGLKVVSVYDRPPKSFHPVDVPATVRRHGNYQNTNIS